VKDFFSVLNGYLLLSLSLVLLAAYDLFSNYPVLQNRGDANVELVVRLDDLGVKEYKRIMASEPKPKKEVPKPKEVVKKEAPKQQEGLEPEIDISMVMTHALNSIKWGQGLNKESFFGSLRFIGDGLLDINLKLNPSTGQEVNINIPFTPVSEVGNFMAEIDEQLTAGLFIRARDNQWHLRFATGPLIGSVFYFTPESDMSFEEIDSYAEKDDYEKSFEVLQNEAIEQRQRALEEQEMNIIPPPEITSRLNDYPDTEDLSEIQTNEVAQSISTNGNTLSEMSMNEYAEETGYEF